MKHFTVSEWAALDIGDAGQEGVLSRRAADALLDAARLAGFDGDTYERALIDGRRSLRAQQVVGVVSSAMARLEILPKIDGLDAGATRATLVHMLARVFDLNIGSGAVAELGQQNEDLLEIVINAFCKRLFDAIRRGLPRQYLPMEADLSALRGRLDLKRQFTTLVTSPQLLACRYDELGPNIALNHVMKAAARLLLSAARSQSNQRLLREVLLAFADVADVAPSALRWDLIVLDRTNAHWADLVAMAKFLMSRRYQTVSGGGQVGFALLFPMNTLFEEYVGRTLRLALRGDNVSTRLQGPRGYVLREEGGAQRFATKPDIVLVDGGRPSLVIDTKWKRLSAALDNPKRGVAQADVYQMLAYARVYGVKRLMLLYPHHQQLGCDEGSIARFWVGGDEETMLEIATIDLGRRLGVEDRLRRLVAQNT